MSDVPDWSTVQSESSELLASGLWNLPAGVSDQIIEINPVPPLGQGALVMLQLPASGLVAVTGVIWEGDDTLFQFGSTLSATGNFAYALVPMPGTVDPTGKLYVYCQNNDVAGVGVKYQVISQPRFDFRGAPQLPQSVGNLSTGPLFVATPNGRPLSVMQSAGGSVQGGSVVLSNNNAQIIPAPAAGYAWMVDTITFTGFASSTGVYFYLGSSAGTLIAQHSYPAGQVTGGPWHPGWIINQPLVAAIDAVGPVRITAAYHQVAIPG